MKIRFIFAFVRILQVRLSIAQTKTKHTSTVQDLYFHKGNQWHQLHIRFIENDLTLPLFLRKSLKISFPLNNQLFLVWFSTPDSTLILYFFIPVSTVNQSFCFYVDLISCLCCDSVLLFLLWRNNPFSRFNNLLLMFPF